MVAPVLAITGASGSCYGVRLLQILIERELHPTVVVSDAARLVMRAELGTDRLDDLVGRQGYQVEPVSNLAAPIASGSWLTAGMVVAPCSMGTVAAIAHGISSTLIHRAADVTLKERRRLILVPRETPLHAGHLQNLLTVATLGALVIPAMPAFYHRPTTVDDLVDSVVARILDQMQIAHPIIRRWGQRLGPVEAPPWPSGRAPQDVPLDDRLSRV